MGAELQFQRNALSENIFRDASDIYKNVKHNDLTCNAFKLS